MGLRALCIIENNLIGRMSALPQTAIYSAPWWGVGADALAADALLVSVADASLIFSVQGAADTSQGFYVTPMAKVAALDIATAPRTRLRQGLRTGMQLGM